MTSVTTQTQRVRLARRAAQMSLLASNLYDSPDTQKPQQRRRSSDADYHRLRRCLPLRDHQFFQHRAIDARDLRKLPESQAAESRLRDLSHQQAGDLRLRQIQMQRNECFFHDRSLSLAMSSHP